MANNYLVLEYAFLKIFSFQVKSVRMLGIMLVVFVRRIDLLYVSNIESEFARTGFGGLWVSCDDYPQSVVYSFVSS
jgi:hypothetical protein